MLELLGKILGALLLALSLASLSTALSHRDIRDFINRRIEKAKTHGAILLTLLSFLIFFGILSHLSGVPALNLFSSAALAVALIYFEIWDMREFWKNTYRPAFKKDVVDIATYLAVVWLISRHVSIPFEISLGISVILLLVACFYSYNLGEYIKLYKSVVVPIDIFPTYIGSRIFSLFFAAHLLSYGFFALPFTLLSLVGYGILMSSMFQAARKIGELKRADSNLNAGSNEEAMLMTTFKK